MRFLVDAQLPPALARHLASQGHEAEHVIDIGLKNATDSEIWNYALELQCILVTKDEDFPNRLGYSPNAPVIVWLRIGNTSRRALLAWLSPLIPQIVKMIELGEWLIVVR